MQFFNYTEALEKAKDAGLQHIRCSLTGQIVASIPDSILLKALEVESYDNPLASEEELLDSMQTRWLVQSSRPAPHLTNHKSKNGFKFLREFHPQDLFAILASRMLFERNDLTKKLNHIELMAAKMQWLVDLQDDMAFQEFGDSYRSALEILVRLDAIHNIRHAFYDAKIREWADILRTESIDIDVFVIFLAEVENSGFIALSKMKEGPKNANSMSLSAALAQHGMTPEQIINEEEREMRIQQARKRAMESINASNAKHSGKVTVRKGKQVVFALHELKGSLPPALEAQYAAELEERKAKRKSGTRAETSKKKAAARFGDIDFNLNF